MSTGSIRAASGDIARGDAVSSVLPSPETTAYLLRDLATHITRRSGIPECEWVGPGVSWQTTRGELAAISDEGDADDFGRIAKLPETTVVLPTEIAPAWLTWWLGDLSRRARRLRGPGSMVELTDDGHLQLRLAEAVGFLREHWAPAAVELHLLVRKVVFVKGFDSEYLSDERVFGAVAVSANNCHSTFDLASQLVGASARLSLHLRAQKAPPIANGYGLRVFPGAKLRDISEGLALAVAVARRVSLTRRVMHHGFADLAQLEAGLAELDGIMDVLGPGAEWANWGHGLYQSLRDVQHETRGEIQVAKGGQL